ncbi:hypothetical protein C0991_009819 [Blastosporella zonata]|nr:hypothetical protein C0991_009819 [Blastosporella zonata]
MPGVRAGHIRRPANSWILFRTAHLHLAKHLAKTPDKSRFLSHIWKYHKIHPETGVYTHFVHLAEQTSQEHKLRNPGYKFKPQPKVGKKKKEAAKQAKKMQREAMRSVDTQPPPFFEAIFPSDEAIRYNGHSNQFPAVGPSTPEVALDFDAPFLIDFDFECSLNALYAQGGAVPDIYGNHFPGPHPIAGPCTTKHARGNEVPDGHSYIQELYSENL